MRWLHGEPLLKARAAKLAEEHANESRRMWDRAIASLETCGRAEDAREASRIRRLSVALARMTKICHESTREICVEAVDAYEALRAGRPAATRAVPAARILKSYVSDVPQARLPISLGTWSVELLGRHGFEVYAERKDARNFSFYLLAEGEPEQVANSASQILSFDYIPSGLEGLQRPTQLAGLEATVFPEQRLLYVGAFARDSHRPSPVVVTGDGKSTTALRIFFCAAMAVMATHLQRECFNGRSCDP